MNKIYIGNLSFNVTTDDLTKLFSGYNIVNINLINDRITGRLRGFGFIEFASHEQAEKALTLNGQEFLDRPLRISPAKPR